jgi:hypothetical protein
MDAREREDKIINPLNNILLLSENHEQYTELDKEVTRVIRVLEEERIIPKRIRAMASPHPIV